MHSDITRNRGRHSCPGFHRDKLQQESRKRLDSPVSRTGQAGQARNDKMRTTYVVMYNQLI